MKFLTLIFMSIATWASAEEVAVVSLYKKPEYRGISISAQGFSQNETKNNHSYREFQLGFALPSQVQLALVYGDMKKIKSTSGGDLQEWEYVEQSSTMNGRYLALEVRKLFYNPTQRGEGSGFFVGLGVGQLDARFGYQYNRYKPYNGFICIIGPCDKSVEESDSGQAQKNLNFWRVGVGYNLETLYLSKNCSFNFIGGINYTQLSENNILAVNGARHSGSFDMAGIDKVSGTLGIGILF